jgi:hypothetical protein
MSSPRGSSTSKTVIVTVHLTTQQYPIVDRIRLDGRMGMTDGEILRNVFLDWCRRKMEGIQSESATGVARSAARGEAGRLP